MAASTTWCRSPVYSFGEVQKRTKRSLRGGAADQDSVQKRLVKRHLAAGSLMLYDLSSSYLEGRHCPLARLGYNQDGKKSKLQVN